jgi:hypothetical protein
LIKKDPFLLKVSKKGGQQMKIKSLLFLAVLLVGLFVLGTANHTNAAPKPEELKIWSAWPEKMDPSKPGLQLLISMINEEVNQSISVQNISVA